MSVDTGKSRRRAGAWGEHKSLNRCDVLPLYLTVNHRGAKIQMEQLPHPERRPVWIYTHRSRWYLKFSPQAGMRASAPSSSHFNALPPASGHKYKCLKLRNTSVHRLLTWLLCGDLRQEITKCYWSQIQALRIEKYLGTKALGKYENQPFRKSNPAVGTNPVQHDRSQRNDKLEGELNRL